MKIKLEDREYELEANGSFMKKYQEQFHENLIMALYNLSQQRDCYACAKLIYCGIQEEQPFDEWLDSFDSPIFCLTVMDEVMDYLTRATEPTVESKYQGKGSKDVKKKMK